MRLAITVDNPLRDLPGLTLLAMHLCQEEASCFLVPMYFSGWEIWSLVPDFILYHYLRINNQAEISAAIGAGIKVGLLDTEGGVSQAMEAYGSALAPDEATRQALSVVCSWGPLFAAYAAKESWYPEKDLEITGQPRFDFYAPPWREAALKLSPYAGDIPSPFVLINSNVFLVNSAFQTSEKDIDMYVKVFGFDLDTVLLWRDLEQQKLADMVDLTKDLVRNFPEINFVFRPHPFERLDTYEKLLEPQANLFIIKKGTVDGWILRAQAVIQHGCATAVEAGMAGAPCFSPGWIRSATNVETAEAVSVVCETKEELFSYISKIGQGEYEVPPRVQENIDRIIYERFYRVDGRSHERVAQAILRSLQENGAGVDLDYCHQRFWRLDGSFKSRLKLILKKALGMTPDQRLCFWRDNPAIDPAHTWKKADKYFDVRRVQELVAAIEPLAARNFPGKWRPVTVTSAMKDAVFSYRTLESVVVKLK
jgi:surface carbohydrate biosynthesis protein